MKRKIYLTLITLFFGLTIYNSCTVTHDTPSQDIINTALRKWNKSYDNYIVIVDFSKPSAEERFYIYDKDLQKFIYSGFCMHGNGTGNTASKPKFSNQPGSHCSSIGFYSISELSKMNRIKSIDIDCFRLDGLSNTNSNARQRGILIHPGISTSILPFEIKGASLPLTIESEGCFTVSLYTMQKLKSIYKNKPMLLYAYY